MAAQAILFVNLFVKFFFLLTPFFALSMFLAMTAHLGEHERRALAARITVSVVVVCLVLFFFGNYLFYVFGITIDAFRVGAGVLLFLTAVSLVQGAAADAGTPGADDIAVVPFSVPIIAGPATIGAILVMAADSHGFVESVITLSALGAAVLCVGMILFLSAFFERVLKKKGIVILSKITGLILSALAAQMVFAGARSLLR